MVVEKAEENAFKCICFILFSNTLKPFSVMKVFAAGVIVGFDLAAGMGDRFGRGWVVLEWMEGDGVEKWF